MDSEEAIWNSGRDEMPNLGYKVRYKGGYFPVPPVDHFADLRDTIVKNLEVSGLKVERAHHEVGTAGQAEINYVYDKLTSEFLEVLQRATILRACEDLGPEALYALELEHFPAVVIIDREGRNFHEESPARWRRP